MIPEADIIKAEKQAEAERWIKAIMRQHDKESTAYLMAEKALEALNEDTRDN